MNPWLLLSTISFSGGLLIGICIGVLSHAWAVEHDRKAMLR